MGNFHTEPVGKQEAAAPSTGMGHLQGDTQKGTPKRDTQKGTPRRGHSKRDTQKGVVPKMLPPAPRASLGDRDAVPGWMEPVI